MYIPTKLLNRVQLYNNNFKDTFKLKYYLKIKVNKKVAK